ncbi:PREDICTED: myosin-11-like isoform X2 [Papilio xuthus]|uniref:Myosin-11-like isoform X2 n=1 Tax=Papilio xuthus TaxID=66420 RepID=A0AAJ6ZDI0_PAPXU|nr:PREDICTED: myosin-11-like isoform X2 [Papilio xuthus]
MNLNEDPNTDDYFVTAVHIFKYCGAESTDTLRVDALMDKFAPFIKTNKAEYSYLKSLLDPEENNPEVSVLTLATVLNKYSENQKIKADLDESFNLKNGQGPHDSDSGISTEGFQLLEELQCELKEKAHLAQQLRSQLDFTDRQHEEQLATVTAERDSLITHLNLLREENIALSHVKRDYEEVCDRLCCSERALEEATRDLDVTRKRARVLVDQLASLESEKVVLQELLQKSKEECHRINEMYASRQSALLEECETLRGQHADLAARLHDHDHYMQQLIKEKVLLEMELKDVFNKSNATQLRMDRSIDVSYTDDQMLTALDSLNLESQFSQENHLLDEESFTNALKEDQGRVTNMSLFDEIRLSFCNMSRRNTINCSGNFDISIKLQNVTTQTEDIEPCADTNKVQNVIHVETQTDSSSEIENEPYSNNNIVQTCYDCTKCIECEKLRDYATKLESDNKKMNFIVSDMQSNLDRYDEYLNNLQKLEEEENKANIISQAYIDGLESNINTIASKCSIELDTSDKLYTHRQTEPAYCSVSTQAEVPCRDCEMRNSDLQHRSLRRYFCM